MVDRLRGAFVASTVVWTLMLAVAPWLASRPHASASGAAVVVAVYALGSIVCHQLPERSFQLWTAQMPVCARCAGIYLGAAVIAVVAAGAARPRELRAASVRAALALAAAPTFVTLAWEWATGIVPSNWIRSAAGIPLGAVVAWLVVTASRNRVN